MTSDENGVVQYQPSGEIQFTHRSSDFDDYEELGGKLQQNVESISCMVDSIGNTLDTAANIANMYKECVLAEERTKQVQAWGQVEMAKTVAKFKTAQDFMEKTFGERDKALSKHYNLLDDAVKSNDRELILAALHGISSIVTKSPLDDFEKFVELYNDTSQPLLDF